MARPPRLELPGVPLHIIQRGNNRTACFFGDVDRHFYLKCLAEAAVRRGCEIHAYVLMSNHVHLLVTPTTPGAAAQMLQDLGRRYVRIINTIHGRTGTLWEGRFKSSLVDTENYLLTCHRYIEMNPVRAGLVRHAADYSWSSHLHYVSAHSKSFITEHAMFTRLAETREERQALFRTMFSEDLDEGTLERIRYAANTGSALGSEPFLREAETRLGRAVRPPIRGRPAKRPNEAADRAESGKLF